MNIEREIYDKKGIIIRNRLQTNGTLISPEWVDFFSKYKFSIGISLDGPEQIFNSHRFYADGKSAYNDVINAIKALKNANIPFGILAVITNESYCYASELYEFFKLLKIESVDFIPLYLPCDSKQGIEPKNWGNFLINIYDLWIKDLSFEIVYLSNLIRKIYDVKNNIKSDGCALLCELSGECGNNPSITSNGDLYYCECLVGLDDYKLGNIFKNPICELLSQNAYKQKDLNQLSSKCRNCKYLKICEGGCLRHRIFNNTLGPNDKDYFCPSKKMIISHIIKNLFKE